MTIDNPHVRQSAACPLCDCAKPVGNVTCWPCYRKHDLKYGNEAAEQMIARREAELSK